MKPSLLNPQVPLWDPGKFCFRFRTYLFFNRQARTFRSSLLWRIGQGFLASSLSRGNEFAKKVLDSLAPDIIFFCYTAKNADLPLYQAIHSLAVQRKIPIFIASTGIAAYASVTGSRDAILPDEQLGGNVLLSPSRHDLQHYYHVEKTMKALPYETLISGDPRLSAPFVQKVTQHYRDRPNIKVNHEPGFSAVIFGTNLPYLCEGAQEPQDQLILKIVEWLISQEVTSIYVRFHPQTSWTEVRDQIQSFSQVRICPAITTSELLGSATLVVSPPTSVLFEAMILGKKILVVDDFEGKTSSFRDYGVQTVTSTDLPTCDLDAIHNQYQLDSVVEFVWGDQADGDCRDKLLAKMIEVIEKKGR